MKPGISLTALAQELERQRDAKRDYVADTRAITMDQDGKRVRMGGDPLEIGMHARTQLAAKLDIPLAHYKRLEEKHPDLLAHQVNNLMAREPSRVMVRTLDGRARGFLSDRYRPLDNPDLAEAVLPELIRAGAIVESCQITESRLYIKALCPWLDREIPMPEGFVMGKGHNFWTRKVIGAVTIGNSEIGMGSIFVAPGIFERQCTNLAQFRDEGFGKMHVGKKANALNEDPVSAYLSDGTKKLEDAAVWSKIRDLVKATMDGRVIDRLVTKMSDARGDIITGDPSKVVEVFAKKYGVNEQERGGLLRFLAESGEMSRYGLQWAVTRLAGEAPDYDRASELERLGGQVIELPRSDWKVLAEAA